MRDTNPYAMNQELIGSEQVYFVEKSIMQLAETYNFVYI
jgi:hypothetical protein